MMYVGTHNVKLDERYRFFVPAQYRAPFMENAMLVFRDDHLGLYDGESFAAFVNKLAGFVNDGVITRADFNLVLELSDAATVDSQGRLVIPKKLREPVGIDKGSITLLGHSDHFAIKPGATEADAEANIYEASRAKVARLLDLGA